MVNGKFHYSGFARPNYTQVPDDVFDVLLPELTESELKVLLYIIRRTFGFKKETDSISLKQMVEGIRTRDGRQLDRGAGISKTSAVRGVNGLVEKGVIVAVRNRSEEKGDEPTTYRLRFANSLLAPEPGLDSPVSTFETPPSPNLEHPRVPDLDPQETEIQQTDEQDFEISKDLDVDKYDRSREVIANFVADFAREFADAASLPSSISRAQNIYRISGLPLDRFLDLMYRARAITKERSAAVRATPDESGRKPRMAYFYAVLEDLASDASR